MSILDHAADSLARQSQLMLGTWRLCDPKISLASIASMFLGACIAARVAPLDWPALALTVFGILILEAAKNAAGEVVDLDSGADLMVSPQDRSPFSGGKRVIVDGLLSRRETLVISVALYIIGIGIGLWIAVTIEPWILAFGLAGVFLAYFYHAAPLKLAYHGWGEFAVALAYGPLICGGTILVQLGRIPTNALLPSLLLGLLIAAFLVINEFPDRHADQAAGKRNLLVRLGPDRAKRLFFLLHGVAYIGILCLPLAGIPSGTWLGLAGLPFAYAASRRLQSATTTAEMIPAQVLTLISFLVAALGSGIGMLL